MFNVVKAMVGGFNDLHTSGSTFAFGAAILYVISTLIIFIENIFTFSNKMDWEAIHKYEPAALQSFFESLYSYSKSDIFLRILDTISSLMIIPVANNIQDFLGNSIMSRVMAGCAIGGSIINMFEGLFSCGLVEIASRMGISWDTAKYHGIYPLLLLFTRLGPSSLYDLHHLSAVRPRYPYVFTIDSLLFAFFLFLLGYLSHEKTEISRGFGTCAIVGGVSGLLAFLVLLLQGIRSIFLYYFSEILTIIENVCLIVCLFWIGVIFKRSSPLPK